MANSLLKWCKTKILSGYKQINVEGNDEMCSGNRSDTEFLVRSSDEEILLTTPTGRSYACGPGDMEGAEISYSVTSSPKFPFERRKRMVEWRGDQGVSCDLSLSEDICERQEFAFTLYDFHGQGRVTKDDIASLVQSTYETVGSSMSLPPSGSRTVKVKLSVAPNEVTGCQKYDNRGQRISNWSCSGTPKESPRTLFNDSSSSLGESPRYYEDWNNSSYRTSPNVTPRTKDSPRVGDSITSPRQAGEYVEPLSPTLECNHSPRQLIEAEEETEGVTPRKTKRRRKVHYQRQELLQMIQANMEKNNLYYPPVKNHSCVHSHQNSHHRRRRKRSFHHQHNTYHGCCCKCPCGVSTQQQQQKCHGSNGCLDPATLKARLMHYDNSTTNNISVSANVDSGSAASCDRHAASVHHHRSRSQDLDTNSPHVFRHHLLDASSSQHQHPLPPSNTPDRPTSPHINHHHQHSHSHHHHIMSGYRHRSRSCDGEEKVKERLGLSYPVPPTTGVYHHNHLAKKKKNNNLESVMRHHNPFADDEAPTWLGKKTSLKDAEIGLIRDLAISLPSKSDENGNSNSSSNNNNNNNNNSSSSFKEYDVNDLIVATKNIRVDEGASGSGNNGCGRSQHVHQHYHHHYHHYPSTPLII